MGWIALVIVVLIFIVLTIPNQKKSDGKSTTLSPK